MNFAVTAEHRVKLKESEKRDKYLDLAWELDKLRNIKTMVIQLVVSTLGTVTKSLVKGRGDLEIRG